MTSKQNGGIDYGPLIGAIDNGTSSTRFVVFSSKTAKLLASHQVLMSSTYPYAGWVEQDPYAVVDATVECIERTIQKLKDLEISSSDIVTLGVTNQRETTILWDKYTGKPLYNAIVWMDNRTQSTIKSLLESKENKDINQFQDIAGLPINPYFSATKYRWLIDNVPEVRIAIYEKRCLFGTFDSWLIWNLTGGVNGGIHVTDVTNASRTLLMNLRTLQWDPILMDFFEIPLHTLPEIRSSSEIYGKMTMTSLKSVPLSGCVGDQHAALIGQLCFNEGDTKCTFGTGCFILSNTGTKRIKSSHGLLTTVAYKLGPNAKPMYALEGSVASGGSTFSWLKENLKMVDHISDIEKLASQVTDSEGVYFVPAFQGLYAPYWEPNARGIICGMTMETDRRHIARAAIEGVGYQIAAVLQSVYKDSGIELNILKVDGGMCKNNLLLQFQADICGINVAKQEMIESTAFGAAIAAGLAEGIDLWNLNELKVEMNVIKPTFSSEQRKSRMEMWKKVVSKSFQ